MAIMYNRSKICESQPKNIEFQSVFVANWCFSVKPNGNTFEFCAKFLFFLTHKNLYMVPLYITDSEYVGHDSRNIEFRSVFIAN
jgi:hypothetical protein